MIGIDSQKNIREFFQLLVIYLIFLVIEMLEVRHQEIGIVLKKRFI